MGIINDLVGFVRVPLSPVRTFSLDTSKETKQPCEEIFFVMERKLKEKKSFFLSLSDIPNERFFFSSFSLLLQGKKLFPFFRVTAPTKDEEQVQPFFGP